MEFMEVVAARKNVRGGASRARTTPEPGFQGHKWKILQETHGAKAGTANQTA